MGGPETLPCDESFKKIWSYFSGNESKPFLNVVFHFPGSLMKPKHTGLRTGRFSSKEQGFMIQVAVPEDIAETDDYIVSANFFLDSIEQALDLSKKRWEKHKIEFPFDKNIEIIKSARNEINLQ
ncbi:hypothetical protein SAMN03080615_02528 [Amphritea atlantica]|uniref:Uncharacterized protein n=2 Tax=Amphritea atlantica TaxID=355243 RepID=A0A1H9IF23_9GAMM|nr:hypothetical protein SAMN03080615_02528 [Amphritea atlantica]